MMKKVTVKQLMLFSLFMAMAWSASAQMKVGENPNTINKGSILELEAKDKGVLYPRVALTASNAWLPLQGTAVAGMTVYNTATVTATTSATTSLSPGFYFWEGAKWNKIATEGAVAEGAEWVYDPTTKQTNLKRSGTAPFTNKVYYDEKGLLRNYTQEIIEEWSVKNNSYNITDNKKATGNILQRNSQSLGQVSNGINYKVLNSNILVADETADNYDICTEEFVSMTEKDNTNNYRSLVGNYSKALHQAKGNASYLIGLSAWSSLANGAKSDGYLVGLRSAVNLFDNSTANEMTGIRTYNVDWGSGTINHLAGACHFLSFQKNASSTIGNVSGVVVQTAGYDNSSSEISDVKAFYYKTLWNDKTNTITVQNEYGLYLEDVKKGTNSNYAIYTNAGDIHFGSLTASGTTSTDITDKVVVADANGVLKTKAATTLVAEAGEWKDGTVSGTNLIYANQAKKSGNDVVITDDGKVGIGTANPKATLEIATSKTDGTEVEGLLIPRISKEAAYKMAIAATKPEESNMIYINNPTYSSTTATEEQKATVADITENGYYFWNGNKWVKVKGEDIDLWQKNATTGNVNLIDADISKEVIYTKNGYRTYPKNKTSFDIGFNYVTDEPIVLSLNDVERYNEFKYAYVSEIKGFPEPLYPQNIANIKNNKVLYLDSFATGGNSKNFLVNDFRSTIIPADFSDDFLYLRNSISTAENRGSGNVEHMISFLGRTLEVGTGNLRSLTGTSGASTIDKPSGSINNTSGITSLVATEPTNASNLYNVFGGEFMVLLRGAEKVSSIYGHRLSHVLTSSFSGSIDRSYGLYIGDFDSGSKANYGLYVRSIDNSIAPENYAIYTNAGDIRFGSLTASGTTSTDTTDKVVVADTKGVLKTKAAATLVAEASEWKDGTVSGTNLIYANQAKKSGNDVVITDDSKVGIGTTNPQATLDVKGSVKIADGTQGSGKVLTSDANGLGTWQALSTGNKTTEWILSGNQEFTTTEQELKGTGSFVGVDEIGASINGSGVSLPAGKYIAFIDFDINMAEYGVFRLVNNQKAVFGTYYGEWLNGSTILFRSSDIINLKANFRALSGPNTTYYRQPPYKESFNLKIIFLKLN